MRGGGGGLVWPALLSYGESPLWCPSCVLAAPIAATLPFPLPWAMDIGSLAEEDGTGVNFVAEIGQVTPVFRQNLLPQIQE